MNIKEGKLNYDQSGRAYPDNPEIDENWECVWEYGGKYYKILGLPHQGEWEEIQINKKIKMEFLEMYTIFKTEEGRIWKIETTLIPKEDVNHWREKGTFITKEDLLDLGVNIL